jgi:hypothetical protein
MKPSFVNIFEKNSNIKFHENPSSGRPVVPCGQTDGRTDMSKLTVAFRNSANARKKCYVSKVGRPQYKEGRGFNRVPH